MIAVGDGGLDTAPFSRFDPVRIDERLAAKLDVVVLPEAMRRLQLGVIRVMPELHRRGVRVLPGGDYGFAYNPIGRNARDLELFVTLFGFTPTDALVAATSHGGELMDLSVGPDQRNRCFAVWCWA